jgi:cytoskeletal protein CcmA (bactofilin family)
VPDPIELFLIIARYFSQEGANLIYSYIGIVIVSLSVTALGWFAFSYRKTRGMLSLCILVMLSGTLLTTPSANALELRHDDNTVTIGASETIDDTLIVVADTVVIDGTVTGDLVLLGDRLVVNGSVGGNLITFGDAITVHGRVGGSVLGAGSSIELVDATVGGDLWNAGDRVSINGKSRISRNAAIATESFSMAGEIERDLLTFGEKVELSGKVGENFKVAADRVSLLGSASVGGNLRVRVDDENDLQRSPDSVVNGEVEILTPDSELDGVSRYATVRYYVRQLLRLVSAFIAGFVLLWLIPGLRDITLSGGISGIKTAGIGLVGLVALPVFMLLFAVTVVGLPFTVVGFFSWLLAIYFAKIVLASVIGQMIFASSEKSGSLLWTLLAGLVAVLFVVNIPVIGGIFNFILTIIGFGLIIQVVLKYTFGLDGGQASR